MKNFVQPGNIMDYQNSGSPILSGSVVVLGSRIGIAIVDIPTSSSGSVALKGAVELPAVNNAAFSQGDDLYWSGTALTKTPTAAYAGMCFEPKAETATKAVVRLQSAPLA